MINTSSAATALRLVRPQFKLFDDLRYTGKPDLTSYGFQDITLISEGLFWPNGTAVEDRQEPNVDFIRSSTIPWVQTQNAEWVVIDIEHWSLALVDIPTTIQWFTTVINEFRTALPNNKLGIYSMVPLRDFFAPVRKATRPDDYAAWLAINTALRPLAAQLDATFPSLYTPYGEDSGTYASERQRWLLYASENLKEAAKYGKPIYAFIWANYLSGTFIDGPYFADQLNLIRQYADGLVFWSLGDSAWDEVNPWWVAAKKFIATLRN